MKSFNKIFAAAVLMLSAAACVAPPMIGIRAGYSLGGIYEIMEFEADDGREWKSGANFGRCG